jgi:hypothetical protein
MGKMRTLFYHRTTRPQQLFPRTVPVAQATRLRVHRASRQVRVLAAGHHPLEFEHSNVEVLMETFLLPRK